MGSIRWKVIYPLGTMVIIGIGTYVLWKRQCEIYNLGYAYITETEPDYEIVVSDAKPSRDYIKPGELIFPSSTLPRHSSTIVSTLSRTSRSSDNGESTVYMVAIYNYHAKMDDELELRAGDRIRVEHQYNDG